MDSRPASFYWLAAFFTLFVLFLYGPTITILILSFQGPGGGLTFPMQGVSLHWFEQLFRGIGVVDIGSAFWNSLILGGIVTVITVVASVMAGLAFRRRFYGSGALFYVAIASLIIPSIVVSLGIALEFRIFDDSIKAIGDAYEIEWIWQNYTTMMGIYSSGLGAHLTWTFPFGLLIMFAVFNRFNPAYEEAARDLGATPWQTFAHVILPIIAPSIFGVALFGFTLSWDEIARSSQAMGADSTLPITLRSLTTTVTTPAIYALGTLTTMISLIVIVSLLTALVVVRRRQARRGSDAGKGVM
ncbi:ABC transporter permease [Methylobrevis pamukkalensis]|uniref:Inner membrane ABC transporter permease protein YdcV n=1 Tax=Methylobrevis pamukkalensis TaxID=1439726 RepID=A0A1E3GTG9_9HYPH|nr:ABC transporter permease [Methylobrevis pamukkalensis]ODN67350.1 Inner membrane ABC transporter permease protein YdcV [Methylobrevis pamukkalensis]